MDNLNRTRRGLYYGWVVVGVAFLVMFVNYGVRGTQTVFVKEIADELNIGRSAVSVPFLVCILIYAFLAPLTGRLVDRYGPRWVMVAGALVSGAGLWMCSRAGDLFTLVLYFGVVFGIGGNGIGLVPSNTSVAMWFRRKLGLALGIATVGIGFGTMILPRITGVVQSHWGWRASFQFLGYTAFALAIPAFFLLRGKKVPGGGEAGKKAPGVGGGGSGAGAGEPWRGNAAPPGGMPLREAMRTPSFWLLFLAFIFIVIALYGVQFHQVPFATDRGIDKGWALWSVTVFGAASIAGRFFFGWLSDRTREKKMALYPSLALLLLGLIILPFVENVWSLMLFAAVFGSGFAAYGPVIPAICAEVFGKANMGAIFGAVTTGGALGGAAGPYLTGFIYDKSGGYTGAWILAMVCVAVSAILFARVRILWKE